MFLLFAHLLLLLRLTCGVLLSANSRLLLGLPLRLLNGSFRWLTLEALLFLSLFARLLLLLRLSRGFGLRCPGRLLLALRLQLLPHLLSQLLLLNPLLRFRRLRIGSRLGIARLAAILSCS